MGPGRRARPRRWATVAGAALFVASGLVPLWSDGGSAEAAGAPKAVLVNPPWADSPTWSQTLTDQGAPIAESSPAVATLDGAGTSVVVGDRAGQLYAFHLSDGSAVSGWPASTGAPVDSTPSVDPAPGSGLDTVYVGAGDAGSPTHGGYESFNANGTLRWHTGVVNPGGDQDPASGVQAGLSLGTLQAQPAAFAGSLGQESYALAAGSGAPLPGWPFFNSDSTFSTAALADLYGTGQTEMVVGGDQTTGAALGQDYTNGGHVRVLNADGGLICRADTNQTVDSSPAVGGFLPGGATGVVTGTGGFFPNTSDSHVVRAYDDDCRPQWTTALDGSTFSSPALADLTGNGALDVVEGTDTGSDGSVYALDGTNGQVLWHTDVGRVIGSVTTADLFGLGHQDVLVPTTAGVQILDGSTGVEVAALNATAATGVIGFQNAPLVTDDPNGNVGITVAGYNGFNQGVVLHYEVTLSDGSRVDEPGSWPQFHHDPQLTGNAGGTTAPGSEAACDVPSAALRGYHLVASDGGIFSFGGQPFCGSAGNLRLTAPVVGMAQAPATGGYWAVASDGGIFNYGGAPFYGSLGSLHLNAPIVGMAATPDGRGYWLVGADGGVFCFGDARFFGSAGGRRLASPVVGMTGNPDGLGYRLVAADGGIFTYGDANFAGSAGGVHLGRPIVGMANDPATGGYWLVGADGGVFSYDAPFLGSMGNRRLAQPVVGIQSNLSGGGYHLVAADGGIFSFGDTGFFGSTGNLLLNRPVVGMAGP